MLSNRGPIFRTPSSKVVFRWRGDPLNVPLLVAPMQSVREYGMLKRDQKVIKIRCGQDFKTAVLEPSSYKSVKPGRGSSRFMRFIRWYCPRKPLNAVSLICDIQNIGIAKIVTRMPDGRRRPTQAGSQGRGVLTSEADYSDANNAALEIHT